MNLSDLTPFFVKDVNRVVCDDNEAIGCDVRLGLMLDHEAEHDKLLVFEHCLTLLLSKQITPELHHEPVRIIDIGKIVLATQSHELRIAFR